MTEFRAHDRRRLSQRRFIGEEVKGDFRNGIAMRSEMEDLVFADSKMECFNFTNSIFKCCTFTGCGLKLASFNATIMENVCFYDCDLDMAAFRHSVMKDVRFVGGRMQYGSFEEADVTDLVLSLDLHGTDLRFGKTVRVDFSGSNLWSAVINIDCAFFAENKFDRRQMEMFLGLMTKTSGSYDIREQVSGMISPETAAIVDRIVRSAPEA